MLRSVEAERGVEIWSYVQVSRTWGLMGLDVFHLFFDHYGGLVGYEMVHIN